MATVFIALVVGIRLVLSTHCQGYGTTTDLTVKFNSSVGRYTITPLNAGVTLNHSDTLNEPNVSYDYKPNTYYSFLMIDPDAPYPEDTFWADYLHCLIINIESANNIWSGDIKMEFKHPAPPPESEPHRYCIFVFETSVKISWPTPSSRIGFNTTAFETYINSTQGGRIEGSTYFMGKVGDS